MDLSMHGNTALLQRSHSLKSLQILGLRWGHTFFSFLCNCSTSFLGVTLSLSDFLTDGFKIKKSWEGRLMACLLTFIPPLIFVLTYQRGFLCCFRICWCVCCHPPNFSSCNDGLEAEKTTVLFNSLGDVRSFCLLFSLRFLS